MSFRVVEIATTPNPNAKKFVLDAVISDQPASFFNAEAAEVHSVARLLFQISGVTSVLLLGDFVTVNKAPQMPWKAITAQVTAVLQRSSP